ncbi:MFS transporter [Nocardioides sp.]|uniref:MFS transporter n=1 Tax=Nocardioides sp. TaxID=35761 RepID=UPI0039E4C113
MTLTGASATTSPWAGRYLATTTGVFALAFLFAFEALAVATVMPDVARDLDGLGMYAVAFAAPLAASVVALAVAGPWADRRGPGPALAGGLVVFCVGVVLAGLAPTMPLFLTGRVIHGLGAGVLGVALYVVVAQAYPEELRPRVFAVLTSAWVLPALVGPGIAALVAHAVGWRWVFLGVPVLAVGAWLLIRATPMTTPTGEGEPVATRRVALGVVAAAGVLLVSVAGQREVPGWPALIALGVAAIVGAGLRLLPAGSWSGRRGLPSVLGTRGFIGAAYSMAEVYVPLLLTLHRGLSIGQAGWVLTTGAVTWCLGATAAARWRRLADQPGRVRIGAVALATGIALFATAALDDVPLLVPVLGWALAGFGIGMAFSTLSVLALDAAPEGEAGRTSSALQLNDYLVTAGLLALGSAVFAGFVGSAPVTGATILVLAAAGCGVLALAPAARLTS